MLNTYLLHLQTAVIKLSGFYCHKIILNEQCNIFKIYFNEIKLDIYLLVKPL